MEISFRNLAAEFLKCETGATAIETAIEYGILVATISLAIVVALQATGTSLTSIISFGYHRRRRDAPGLNAAPSPAPAN